MAIINSPATATELERPACTIIAKNPLYYDHVIERWPYCIIKQTYNPSGLNYTPSADQSSPNPSPTPNSNSGSKDDPALTAVLPLGILGAVAVGFLTYVILCWIARAIQNCRGRRRGQTVSQPIGRRRRKTGFREVGAWISRLFARHDQNSERSVDSALRLTSIQRGLHRIRIFGKSPPRSTLSQSPNSQGHEDPGQDPHQGEAANLPPSYESVAHLPPLAIPLAAHLPRESAHDGPSLPDYNSPLQNRDHVPFRRLDQNFIPINEPPPPDYNERHQDVLYTSDTESERDLDVANGNDASDDNVNVEQENENENENEIDDEGINELARLHDELRHFEVNPWLEQYAIFGDEFRR